MKKNKHSIQFWIIVYLMCIPVWIIGSILLIIFMLPVIIESLIRGKPQRIKRIFQLKNTHRTI